MKDDVITLTLGLGDPSGKMTQVSVNLNAYLADGTLFTKDQVRCYVPIFVTDERNRGDYAIPDSWVLGNMFLDKYFVVHDNEESGPSTNPKVGIYLKAPGGVIEETGAPPKEEPPVVIEPAKEEPAGGGGAVVVIILLVVLAIAIGVFAKFYGK